MAWTFVALGDSMTEGVGDPLPDGSLLGWAGRLSGWLTEQRSDLRFENLARRSLTTAEIRESQLPVALEMRPNLASVIAGVNDALKPEFNAAVFEREFTALIEPLSEAGATVLTATFPNVRWGRLLSAQVRSTIHGRLEEVCDVVRRVASEHDALCVDAWNAPETTDPRVMSIDRLHPSPWGHRLMAVRAAELLNERFGLSLDIAEPAPGERVGAGAFGQARWMARHVFSPYVRERLGRLRSAEEESDRAY